MNRFLHELIKLSLCVSGIVGLLIVIFVVSLCLWPEVLRWEILILMLFSGLFLCAGAVYGYFVMKAKTP